MKSNSVLSVLKEGSIISTRFGTRNTWYPNTVCRIKNNHVYIPLIQSYLQNIIMPGSDLIIKYTCDHFEYIFEGVVCEIVADYPSYVVLKINKSEEIMNSRYFQRYDTYLASSVRPNGGTDFIFSIIINISLTGIAFISKHEFDYSEDNEVGILIPGRQKIYGKGKIIRKSAKEHYFEYSMQFTDMDDLNNNILSDYLTQLETDVLNLLEDYEHNFKGKLKG